MKINRKILTIVTLCYIYLPIFFFFVGWTNVSVALISLVASLICIYRFIKSDVVKTAKTYEIIINPVVFIVGFAFLVFIGIFAGWGRFTLQTGDWLKHDAVLCDLVKRPWPVLYDNDGERSMLAYYIAQYLVPAAIGKITGSVRVAEIILLVWNEIGLVLVYLHLLEVLVIVEPVKQLSTVLILPLFSVPLWFSEVILGVFVSDNRVGQAEWFYRSGDILLQYSNNSTLLQYVFPQALSAWIIMMLFLEYKENIEYYLLLMFPGVLFATFPFLGIVSFAGIYGIADLIRNRDLKKWISKIVSVENILILLTQGIVFALYFLGNVLAPKPSDIGFKLVDYSGLWAVYFVFVIVNVLIYGFVLYKDNKSNIVYYVSIGTLVILPFFRMGRYNDLGMRSSIPALFVLMVMVIKYFNEHFEGKTDIADSLLTKMSKFLVVILLVIGFIYPIRDFLLTVDERCVSDLGKDADIDWISLELFANRNLEGVEDDLKYNYYTYDYENDLFYKYLADKKNQNR